MEEHSYRPCPDEGGKRMVEMTMVRERRFRKKEGKRRKSKDRKTRWEKL
jgi:hypothetical protein